MPKLEIAPRPGLEIFVNRSGTISIAEIDHSIPPKERSIVTVHPDDVPKVIQMLSQAQQDAADFVPEEEEEPKK
jgi:hypothetical protein